MSDPKVHLPVLPTGKPHISFSELATWLDCPWKHHLTYVKKVQGFDGNEHTYFGGHVHEGCEDFLNTGNMPIEKVLDLIAATWDDKGYKDKDDWIAQAKAILEEVPGWMDETFPNWEPIIIDDRAAEHMLYESLGHIGHPDNRWKGMVDAAIKHTGARGKEVVRILDWKTTSWGWHKQKLREFKTNAQAAAYKIFWSRKYDIDMKDIRAAYVLLKRTAKPGGRCQLIEVSVGPKMEQKINESIDKMLRAVKAGHHPKNRMSCRFCDYNATEHCPGLGPI